MTTATMVRPRDQSALGKIDEASPPGYTHRKVAQRPDHVV